ncbi:hypothetical protein [Thermotoga sp. SG1]|uniref:hypothetical protein n=1 Tax=Thermotoga sp. SG1 TaxID=126739 RepID=UPI000C78766A|nr:hypothetical protein [Thermotoga sp. SG1]PLV56145.1 hypothetical protein AS006_06175 [Thermotoga sp. SG1]
MIWILTVPLVLSVILAVMGRNRWEKLLGISSLSTKTGVLIYALSYLVPGLSQVRDVAIFYLLAGGSGIILFSYFLRGRKE